jgi:hypothetical protein
MGAKDAITIVVPEDSDPFLFSDGAKHAIYCLLHRRNRKWIWEIIQGRRFEKRIDVLDAATGQYISQRMT